jgi:hypothetical protein
MEFGLQQLLVGQLGLAPAPASCQSASVKQFKLDKNI